MNKNPNDSDHGSQTGAGRKSDGSVGADSTTDISIESDASELPVAEGSGLSGRGARITQFEQATRHEAEWQRTPNTTGSGAIHLKTFHCKLTDDALRFMDQSINEWLDNHPQYEVKFVTTTVGTLTGKLKEPHLICQVWV